MQYKHKRLIDIIIRLIATGLLIWAIGRHPYNYYKLLRWIVFGTNAYIAIISMIQRKYFWTILTGSFAILFNPFIPFHFDRDTWRIIDLVAAGEIITTIFFVKGKKNEEKNR